MEKIKVIRSTSYTVLDNEIAFDKAVGLTALGLHRYVMTMHTAGRNITLQDLINYRNADSRTARDGRRAVTTAMNQLIEAGYVKRGKETENGKFVTWIYHISEYPMWKNQTDFIPVDVDGDEEKPNVRFPNAQNVHSEKTAENDRFFDEKPNVQNVHSKLSKNILSNAHTQEAEVSNHPVEVKNQKDDFVPPAAPPAALPDIETVICDVHKFMDENPGWVQLQADRYDAAKYGTVKNQAIRFCCYYGTPSEGSRFINQFYQNPTEFFRRRFPMWLLDESYYKRKIDLPQPSAGPRQTYQNRNYQTSAPETPAVYTRPQHVQVDRLISGIVSQKLNEE